MNYPVSLLMGLLVGCLYGATKVQSPAPPIIALIGLFGIILGESGISYLRQALSGGSKCTAEYQRQEPELFGHLSVNAWTGVDEDALGGEPLETVACDGVAVVKATHLIGIGRHRPVTAAIHANADIPRLRSIGIGRRRIVEQNARLSALVQRQLRLNYIS